MDYISELYKQKDYNGFNIELMKFYTNIYNVDDLVIKEKFKNCFVEISNY